MLLIGNPATRRRRNCCGTFINNSSQLKVTRNSDCRPIRFTACKNAGQSLVGDNTNRSQEESMIVPDFVMTELPLFPWRKGV